MKKILVSIILYFFLNVNTFGHLQHYSGVKYLEYDLYRNNSLIGSHKYDFLQNGSMAQAKTIFDFSFNLLNEY